MGDRRWEMGVVRERGGERERKFEKRKAKSGKEFSASLRLCGETFSDRRDYFAKASQSRGAEPPSLKLWRIQRGPTGGS